MNEADLLERAADLIETVGHCKDISRRFDPTGAVVVGYCALGALSEAASRMDLDYRNEAELKLSAALGEVPLIGPPAIVCDCPTCVSPDVVATGRIASWNDNPSRTGAEVVEKMKQVAKDLRNTAA